MHLKPWILNVARRRFAATCTLTMPKWLQCVGFLCTATKIEKFKGFHQGSVQGLYRGPIGLIDTDLKSTSARERCQVTSRITDTELRVSGVWLRDSGRRPSPGYQFRVKFRV